MDERDGAWAARGRPACERSRSASPRPPPGRARDCAPGGGRRRRGRPTRARRAAAPPCSTRSSRLRRGRTRVLRPAARAAAASGPVRTGEERVPRDGGRPVEQDALRAARSGRVADEQDPRQSCPQAIPPAAGGLGPSSRRDSRAPRSPRGAGAPHRLPSVVLIASRPATKPRVALVHDFLLDVRGAERVFLQLCAMWPDGRHLHRRLRPATGPRAASPTGSSTPRFCSASGPPRGPSGRCSRCIRPRSSPSTSPAMTWWSPAPRRGRTRCAAPRTRSTSAIATTRSATPGTIATAPWPAATRSRAGSCAPRFAGGANGTGPRLSGPTATSPTPRSPRRGSAPTSAARPTSSTRRSIRGASRRGRWATTTPSSPS